MKIYLNADVKCSYTYYCTYSTIHTYFIENFIFIYKKIYWEVINSQWHRSFENKTLKRKVEIKNLRGPVESSVIDFFQITQEVQVR